MDRFSKMHPTFQFTFFVLIFVLSVSIYNPIFTAISLVCGLIYSYKVNGRKALSDLKFSLAILVIVSLFNMLFAHYGQDVLFVIKSTKFTLEALFYGFNQGLMVSSMIIWFSLFGKIVDSEKVIYLFRFTPKLALLFSMVLGFIPRFSKKLNDIRDAKLGLNSGEKPKGIKEKFSFGASNLSALITYSLESSIVTADSMSARGYNPRAIRVSRYKIKIYDIILILFTVFTFSYVLYTKLSGKITFIFDPKIYIKSFDVASLVCFIVLCLLPILVDLVEEIIWKISVSKI